MTEGIDNTTFLENFQEQVAIFQKVVIEEKQKVKNGENYLAVREELDNLKYRYQRKIQSYKYSENTYIEENRKLKKTLCAAMTVLKEINKEEFSWNELSIFLDSAIPPGCTDSEKVKELEKKLLKANQELEDCKQKHRTDIEFYDSSLESFTKTCIKEYTMIKNKLNVAEDKIKEINEKCVTKANFDTLLEPAAEA